MCWSRCKTVDCDSRLPRSLKNNKNNEKALGLHRKEHVTDILEDENDFPILKQYIFKTFQNRIKVKHIFLVS